MSPLAARPRDWLARRSPTERGGIGFVAGLASALGFSPIDAWPLTLAGLGLLLLLIPLATSLRNALALGWWFGFGHMLAGLYWIAQAFNFQDNMPAWSGWVAVVLLSIVMAIYPAVATAIAWRFSSAVARTLAFAGAWMLTEWLRGYLFGGFPWNPLGVVTMPLLPVAQAASLIGGLGLSGMVILVAGAIILALTDRAWRFAGGIAALAGAAVLAGVVGLSHPTQYTAARLLIVQANIGQADKWRDGAEEANLRRYLTLSAEAKRDGRPGLLLWPEAAVIGLLDEEPWLRRRLARLLGPGDMLLTGGVKAVRNSRGRAVGARNSLFVIGEGGRIEGRYDKKALVPFGEYLPLRGVMETLGVARLAPGTLDFWPGPGPRTLRLPGFPPVGPLICYEIVRPGHVVAKGARPSWLLNASNDAWFSDAGAWMHLEQARLRAIEEGLPIARSTPTGISAMIDGRGRLLATIGRGRAGVLAATIPTALAPTPFARLGSLIPLSLALLLIAAALLAAKRNYQSKI